ncbi:hypothetical protein [Planococcus lenghuensis]|uniref:Uncharacterized protein n=1 Tax=Planococcus lenghuensis TaxID=2213202 RepID=A0A1Q2KVP3_9BACL|nr:hypothetical protein [Planococcus lenghuensis]AQQ52186.1 hypothetical protein B0X71_03035 [Planococcus lenghuensis]
MLLNMTGYEEHEPTLEELQQLYRELTEARGTFAPKPEELEEDDEAALLLESIAQCTPTDLESYAEAVELLVFLLTESGWHEDELEQLRLENLLSRANAAIPDKKRTRRAMLIQIKRIEDETADEELAG